MKNSRALANTLRKAAQYLDECPEFKYHYDPTPVWITFYDKEDFIKAVNAVGTGEVVMNASELSFRPENSEIELRISRRVVSAEPSPEPKWTVTSDVAEALAARSSTGTVKYL